jgi:cytochrome c553
MTSRTMLASGAMALLAVLLCVSVRAQDVPDAVTGPPGDPLAGRKVARMCAVCHGINGLAKQPDAANLAGQDPGYLVRQLTAFKSGARRNETMNAMAQVLNQQQMRDVAAYFGGIKIAVTQVPGQ